VPACRLIGGWIPAAGQEIFAASPITSQKKEEKISKFQGG
jgi:hypothetical protein